MRINIKVHIHHTTFKLHLVQQKVPTLKSTQPHSTDKDGQFTNIPALGLSPRNNANLLSCYIFSTPVFTRKILILYCLESWIQSVNIMVVLLVFCCCWCFLTVLEFSLQKCNWFYKGKDNEDPVVLGKKRFCPLGNLKKCKFAFACQFSYI